MSGIISYVKRIGVWLCIVIACETIMIITMMLNKIPFAEIGYGIFISLFLLLILLAFDAMRYYRHYQKVKELEHTIMLSTDGMPENADLLENEYQRLLRILSDEYTGAQSRAATRQKNMQEYYAMWVHQVKTPIAALRLLLQNKNDEGQMTEELSELFGKDEEHPLEPYNVTEEKKLMVCLPEKQKNNVQYKPLVQPAEELQEEITMQGRLLGGCMDCLVNLLGTEFDKVQEFTEKYQDDGIIWFLESCDLNVMSIRRAVWQMKHAGWFSHVKGFLIGRPAVFGQEMMGLDQYHAVTDLLAGYQVPVIMDADIGHIPPMMPLVCGSYADISVSGNALKVNMQWK